MRSLNQLQDLIDDTTLAVGSEAFARSPLCPSPQLSSFYTHNPICEAMGLNFGSNEVFTASYGGTANLSPSDTHFYVF
ncbi:MAG: hypothetical protein RMX68_032470 [Aulosira sp. ZfuVER01]|nr:hypothetical protein [Aulosira sp. ZfuVER01]MDZ8000422.1 hypothetical protein [Aulosira sp. DedVER01a]MDZ8052894.1 hypothetical protein [Aulosira sp. ZfuCHP01]